MHGEGWRLHCSKSHRRKKALSSLYHHVDAAQGVRNSGQKKKRAGRQNFSGSEARPCPVPVKSKQGKKNETGRGKRETTSAEYGGDGSEEPKIFGATRASEEARARRCGCREKGAASEPIPGT